MHDIEKIIRECITCSNSRMDLWIHLLRAGRVKTMAEIGVYKGDFAAQLLTACDSIEKYYMIDPWRHLDDWNKPANTSDEMFNNFLLETKSKTDFAASKRIILRGKTTEAVQGIPDGELDCAYIDGDHTLKGITIDLIRIFPKVKDGGWICGDDFCKSIWQHATVFEPTLIFPFAVYFAEATGARIYALPHAQFLIEKDPVNSFAFIDLTGSYNDISIRGQLHPGGFLKLRLKEKFSSLKKSFSK